MLPHDHESLVRVRNREHENSDIYHPFERLCSQTDFFFVDMNSLVATAFSDTAYTTADVLDHAQRCSAIHLAPCSVLSHSKNVQSNLVDMCFCSLGAGAC